MFRIKYIIDQTAGASYFVTQATLSSKDWNTDSENFDEFIISLMPCNTLQKKSPIKSLHLIISSDFKKVYIDNALNPNASHLVPVLIMGNTAILPKNSYINEDNHEQIESKILYNKYPPA